jgi:hypothetical protein
VDTPPGIRFSATTNKKSIHKAVAPVEDTLNHESNERSKLNSSHPWEGREGEGKSTEPKSLLMMAVDGHLPMPRDRGTAHKDVAIDGIGAMPSKDFS